MSEHYWQSRCGATRVDGARCLNPGKPSHGGRCPVHGARAVQPREPAPAQDAPTRTPSRCKALNAHGWPCRLRPVDGHEHCAHHLCAAQGALVSPPEAGSCKTLRANGTPCRCTPLKGHAHCWQHLRDLMRSATLERTVARRTEAARTTLREQRLDLVTDRVRNEKRLEAENDDLRRQITALTVELEKTRAALQLARVWKKPSERVNGEVRP
jgi:hypothetical protein